MHRISPQRAVGFDQPWRFDLHALPGLVGKAHFALHQFHARAGAQFANLIPKLARRTFALQKEKLFTASRVYHMDAGGFGIRLAIDHLVVVDLRRHIGAAHRSHRHAYPFAFHNERLAVTRRIEAGQAHAAARPLPPGHRQPRFLLHRLESGRRCQVFLLRRRRLARAESGDFTSTHALVAGRNFDARRFPATCPFWSSRGL